MRVKSIVSLIIVFVFFTSNASSAKEDIIGISAADKENIQKYMESSNYFEIMGIFERGCGHKKDLKLLTIDERKIEFDESLKCLINNRAALLSMTSTFEEKSKVDQLFSPLIDAKKKEESENQSSIDFMGLTWGVGFGYSFSSDEAIDDAEIVNGVVRVKSNKKEQPRLVLEFHKYFWFNDGRKDGTRGLGPFVAVAATQDDLLSGVGIGFMYGLKAKQSDPEGFSIGIGAILDADVKDLADGFSENAPPPGGETTVRFKQESRWSALLFVTRTF